MSSAEIIFKVNAVKILEEKQTDCQNIQILKWVTNIIL